MGVACEEGSQVELTVPAREGSADETNDTGATHGTLSIGLPASEPASRITGAEAERYCEAVSNTYLSEFEDEVLLDYACMASAVQDNLEVEAGAFFVDDIGCEHSHARCLESTTLDHFRVLEGFDLDQESCVVTLAHEAGACNARVSDVEACFEGMLAYASRVTTQLRCEPNFDPSLLSSMNSPSTLGSCQALHDACPELSLFDDAWGGDRNGGWNDDWEDPWDDNEWGDAWDPDWYDGA